MTGLLLKDLLNLKKVMKQYLLILLAMSVWAYMSENLMFVCRYVTLCSSMLVLTSFSYDEYAHFDKYALTMPIGKRTLVQAKYVLLLLCVGGGTVLGLLAGCIMNLILQGDLVEMLVTGLVISSVFFVTYSLVLPVIFKLGVEKARLAMVAIYLLIFVVVYGAAKMMDAGSTSIPELSAIPWLILAGVVSICVIAALVSYFISLKIIEKKEW